MARVFKNAGVQRARVYASFGPVWVATHGVELEVQVQVEVEVELPPRSKPMLMPLHQTQ